jgi:zinc transporter ZupT
MVDGHHSHHHHQPNSIARHNSIAHGIQLPESTCGGGEGVNESTLTIPHGHQHHHHHDHELRLNAMEAGSKAEDECPDEQNNFASSVRAVLTLIALSFHELMEGIAIGTQVSCII